MSSDLIKFFVTLATKIVDAADGMVNLAGSIPTITAAISGVLSVMQMSGKLKNGAGKVNMPFYIRCIQRMQNAAPFKNKLAPSVLVNPKSHIAYLLIQIKS